MKKLIMSGALGAAVLLVSACGDDADTAEDTAVVEETETADAATTASADWPAGTRIVEESGTFVRINPDNTRVVLGDDEANAAAVNDGMDHALVATMAAIGEPRRGVLSAVAE